MPLSGPETPPDSAEGDAEQARIQGRVVRVRRRCARTCVVDTE